MCILLDKLRDTCLNLHGLSEKEEEVRQMRSVNIGEKHMIDVLDLTLIDTITMKIRKIELLDAKPETCRIKNYTDDDFKNPKDMLFSFGKWGWLGKRFQIKNMKM